ncbi:hypothetical protein Q3O60_15835 [Alkalimonas collagenimarina]|uniref:Beta-ketoacyl synthase N-terminal domain-containing protein n=1 Tax=Alkalimonas collagenimarina TaxID=400390 RepID=A0ABT9H2W3_9GAMM|nr:hypothetical protein [Alkalimonas collagenimarina]MDP4537657.1 hypothetical protein [Alkalimonas collagenimarina]
MVLKELAVPAQQLWSDDSSTMDLDPLVPATASLVEQLVALLSALLATLEKPIAQQPVYLLLPEAMEDESLLSTFTRQIRTLYPELLAHKDSRAFPYGACSALLALKTVQHSWQKDPALMPWMIAIDSPLQQFQLWPDRLQSLPENHRPVGVTEGAVAVQWSAQPAGLSCRFNETELTRKDTAEDAGLQALLLQIAQQLDMPLATIYLPDNGSTLMTDAWLSACGQLHPWVTAETDYELLAYHTGELGSSGGLYRLLHLYLAYQNQARYGLTLQCEQGQLGFRSAAVFHWQSTTAT